MNRLIKKYYPLFAFYCIFMITSNLFAVRLQFFKGEVLDAALEGNSTLTRRALTLLSVFIILECISYFIAQVFAVRFRSLSRNMLRKSLFESITNQEVPVFRRKDKGEYIAEYSQNITRIDNSYFRPVIVLVELISKVIFVCFALFSLNWVIAVVTISLMVLPVFLPRLWQKKLQDSQSALSRFLSSNMERFSQCLDGFEVIVNFSAVSRIRRVFNTDTDSLMKQEYKADIIAKQTQLLTMLLSYLSYFVILCTSAVLTLTEVFTAGDFFISIGMIDQLSYPIISIAGAIQAVISIKPVKQKFLEECAYQKKVRNDKNSFSASIALHNVSFAYSDERKILDDLSLEFRKNRKYLIKGDSGRGKTTIINLLLGYYTSQEGQIEIDSEDISDYSLNKLITVVRQDSFAFSDTLRNNLSLYDEAIPDSRLLEVLESVNLDIGHFNNGLDTVISKDDVNLSGGELKRLSIARAILKDSEILILDEPFANLDENNIAVIKEIVSHIKDKTEIAVSHQMPDNFTRVMDAIFSI